MPRFVDPDLEWTYVDPSLEDPEPQVCRGSHELESDSERGGRSRGCGLSDGTSGAALSVCGVAPSDVRHLRWVCSIDR
jgi:hypothetical protein